MRRYPLFAVTAMAAVALLAYRSGTSAALQGQGGLPGARAEVRAAEFPSLQAAIDALPAEGGVMTIPAGTFDLTQTLVLRKGDVLIRGSGTATHLRSLLKGGEPALAIRPPDPVDGKKQRLWRVKLADFRLTGNPESGPGIQADGVDELFLDGLSVSEHGGDGIRMTDCYEDPRIVGCLITYNKAVGLNLSGCHDIVVSACQFEENQDALRCADGFNLCMTGNCVDDHLRNGVVIENTYGSVVSGNMIEECNGTAIVLDRDCYGITLSANVIAHEQGGGIELKDAHGCAVSANTFTIVKQNALVIGPDSGRITVSGNNFSDSTVSPGKKARNTDDLGASGIRLDGTSDVAIGGNLFSALSTPAIEAGTQPVKRVLVDGNVFTEVPPGRLQGERVEVGDKVD